MYQPGTVDNYIRSCAPEVQAILRKIRATIRKAAPKAEERISYRMPAFFQDGVLVYVAAFKKHIGLFPPVRNEALKSKLAKYAGPKGNLQFQIDEPIPYSLITKIVQARRKENREKRKPRKATRKRASSPPGRSAERAAALRTG
jgi:uncharacterized protein YdhG (YjbR/CyaY superfamily)